MDLLAKSAADGLLNEDAASLLDGEDGPSNRTVVLVGVTGDGKSSTGNTLAGSEVFAVDGGFQSVTQECSQADYIHAGGFWRIIDTIGLQDTGLSEKEVLDRFSTFADKTPAGIDVFLFVVRWGRFKPEHDAALSSFLSNCGEEVLPHTILVFTHCAESPEGVQRALAENAPDSLRDWLSRLRGGAVGIDNAPSAGVSSEARKVGRGLLHQALERLVEGNKGLRYSNEALGEARRRAAQREEAERAAFATAVADWRKGSGPVIIEREDGVVTRPAGDWKKEEPQGKE